MIITPWGYDIDAESMPPIIDADQFDELTGGRWTGDERVEPAIAAVAAAVRSYCGWHVGPSCACSMELDGEPGDIWLPVGYLASVEGATVDGEQAEVVGFNRRGRVRLAHCIPRGLGNVSVEFTAGIPVASMPDLSKAVCDAVVGQIALDSYGVSQETAGDVSISYSGTALSAQGMLLPMNVRAALAPYKVVRAHAV